MSTVTFHNMNVAELERFAPVLSDAVADVLSEYPAVSEYLVEFDTTTGDVNFGLRFSAVNTAFVESMANEILEEAVQRTEPASSGSKRIEAEREESVLFVTQ